jgi:hypothetical protein
MLCSVWWIRDLPSLVSLFPMRPVVLSMRYLALKRLLSATRRIFNEGHERSGQSPLDAYSMSVMKGQNSRYNLPSVCNKFNELGLKVQHTWWACQCVMIDYHLRGQCTRYDTGHRGKKWLERYVLSRLLHRMLSTQHPLSSSFLPAKGLQACYIILYISLINDFNKKRYVPEAKLFWQ